MTQMQLHPYRLLLQVTDVIKGVSGIFNELTTMILCLFLFISKLIIILFVSIINYRLTTNSKSDLPIYCTHYACLRITLMLEFLGLGTQCIYHVLSDNLLGIPRLSISLIAIAGWCLLQFISSASLIMGIVLTLGNVPNQSNLVTS